MTKIIPLILLAVTLNASARINETKEQCVKRYGKPVRENNNISLFKHNSFYIVASIKNSKVYEISYAKLDAKDKLSSYEVKQILKINDPSGWQILTMSNSHTLWANSDESIYALHKRSGLTITSKKSIKQKDQDQRKQEEKDLKGL